MGAGLLNSLAEVAKRLLQDRAEDRGPGGVSRRRSAAGRPGEAAVVPVSSFRMVGLAEVQGRLADRWPAVAEKVHATARSVIQRHLVRGDVFDQHGDDGYLVLFATLGPDEAEFKSRIIAREIVERLLGEDEAAGLNIAAHCAAIPAQALVDGDVAFVLDQALEAAESKSAPTAPVSEAASAPWVFAADGPGAEGATHGYSPVWDTRQMTLLHFRAHASRAWAEFDDRTRELQAYKSDIALVRAVAVDLRGLAAEGRRLPVTVAIEHSSLSVNSQRASVIQALAVIPGAARKILTLEISAPSDGFWTYGCKSFLEMIRPLGVGLAARVRLDEAQAMPPAGGLKCVATDLEGPPLREAASLRLLTAFGGLARAQGHECAAYGLKSRALVLGAIGAGFRYVAGPAVHPDVGGLSTALRFEPIDLYADIQRAAARAS
ncbi:hypothetical protein [Phenylobacterium sp.]|uniref:hypothetical protein n=1 Tax=Phenylobacterium sp. TaxID=1871053 RepID=UPI0012248237|nr:hypothetical protein [Phenylobacterium sp.]THD59123.1 MAG: hypothetical protein E8A49_17115 [Phenylobacterium sp.]